MGVSVQYACEALTYCALNKKTGKCNTARTVASKRPAGTSVPPPKAVIAQPKAKKNNTKTRALCDNMTQAVILAKRMADT